MNIEGQVERKKSWRYVTEGNKLFLVVSLASCKHSFDELKRGIATIPGVVFDPVNAVRHINGEVWVAVQEEDQETLDRVMAEVKRPVQVQIRLPNSEQKQ